jgi:hypothetical protein
MLITMRMELRASKAPSCRSIFFFLSFLSCCDSCPNYYGITYHQIDRVAGGIEKGGSDEACDQLFDVFFPMLSWTPSLAFIILCKSICSCGMHVTLDTCESVRSSRILTSRSSGKLSIQYITIVLPRVRDHPMGYGPTHLTYAPTCWT